MGYNPEVKKLGTLLLLTLAVFVVAVVFVIRFVASSGNDSVSDAASDDRIFVNSLNINKPERFISVSHHDEFTPRLDKDFLLFFWFNLKKLPEPGERLVLLSKYEGTPPRIKGYAVGIRRDLNSIRPVVFWGDGSNKGRWFDFPEVSISSRNWNMFALHVDEGKFIGLYSAAKQMDLAKDSLAFLGGYELLNLDTTNIGTADLIFGASSGRDFRGRIGPMGIINSWKVASDQIIPTLNSYIGSPMDFSILADESDYKLLITDSRTDSSELKLQIKAPVVQ